MKRRRPKRRRQPTAKTPRWREEVNALRRAVDAAAGTPRPVEPPTSRLPAARYRLAEWAEPNDAQRLVHLRDGFLAELVKDLRVGDWFAKWRPSVTELLKPVPPSADVEESMSHMRDDALFFVRELGLPPWRWLADLQEIAVAGRWFNYVADLGAPAVRLASEPRPGESIDEARARVDAAHAEARATLERDEEKLRAELRAPKSGGACAAIPPSMHSYFTHGPI